MTLDLISLTVIALVAALTPVIAEIIPKKAIPETVFLLVFGALLGPYAAGAIQLTDAVDMLSELGLGFLFLMAGYEIDPKMLTGHQGRVGALTWCVTLVIALGVTLAIPYVAGDSPAGHFASALVLTTTALGTLLPILQERDLLGTRVGDSVLAYGTWGELLPIIVMAIMLSSRATWQTAVILLAFALVCVLLVAFTSRAKRADSKLVHLMQERADTTSQTVVRAVIVLLVGLLALSAVFDLDVVLGAFAAGFILRTVFPDGNETLETKLNGIGYGFFIPLFFIVSGAKVNLAALAEMPLLLVAFICLLLIVRATPIYFALKIDRDTRDISPHNRLAISLYCTTALPLIVAITSVAVSAGTMSNDVASVLVGAGALTVFLMPLLANIATRVVDAQPIKAVQEISENPRNFRSIVGNHLALERVLGNSKLTPEQRRQLIETAAKQAGKLYERQHRNETPEEEAARREALSALENRSRTWLLDHLASELERRREEEGTDPASWYKAARKYASTAAERAQRHADLAAEVAERVNEIAEQSAGKDSATAESGGSSEGLRNGGGTADTGSASAEQAHPKAASEGSHGDSASGGAESQTR
ncbi:MAG: cation:proton antiporter [Eggerthellaceae bacterium]|jgi:Kef-type K+ transport system membrane component KefB